MLCLFLVCIMYKFSCYLIRGPLCCFHFWTLSMIYSYKTNEWLVIQCSLPTLFFCYILLYLLQLLLKWLSLRHIWLILCIFISELNDLVNWDTSRSGGWAFRWRKKILTISWVWGWALTWAWAFMQSFTVV